MPLWCGIHGGSEVMPEHAKYYLNDSFSLANAFQAYQHLQLLLRSERSQTQRAGFWPFVPGVRHAVPGILYFWAGEVRVGGIRVKKSKEKSSETVSLNQETEEKRFVRLDKDLRPEQ